MTRWLWEGLWRLAAVCIAIELVLIFVWSVQRAVFWRRAVWVGFVMGPLLLILSHMVVTSREHVTQICRELARAIDLGDVSAIRAALDPEFLAADLDANAFTARVEEVLSRARVDQPRLSAFTVTLPSSNEAVAEFTASAHIRAEQAYIDWVVSRWRVTFLQSGDRWLVTNIETVRIPPLNLPDLRELLR